jgi:hypothetical protein
MLGTSMNVRSPTPGIEFDFGKKKIKLFPA